MGGGSTVQKVLKGIFNFFFFNFVGLKTRFVKSGLDHQTKNPLKKRMKRSKWGWQSGKMRKSTSVTIKYI